MRTKKREIILGTLIAALGAATMARSQADDEASRFAGTWRGDSVCAAKNTACRDEAVVYRVARLSTPGHVSVSADKIVRGRAIHMGELEFHYDQQSQNWLCQYSQGVWRLTMRDAKVAGTLTLPDGTLFRQITLRKDPR